MMIDSSNTYGQYDQVGASAPFPLDVIVDQQGVVRYLNTRYDPGGMADVIDGLLEK